MVEVIAILDTTAKVALGALIAGLSGYWLSGMRSKQNVQQQRTMTGQKAVAVNCIWWWMNWCKALTS